MARVLCVTLSIEWQCEQFACANALPASALGSAMHEVPTAIALKAPTTDDMMFLLNPCIQVSMKPMPRTSDVIGSSLMFGRR